MITSFKHRFIIYFLWFAHSHRLLEILTSRTIHILFADSFSFFNSSFSFLFWAAFSKNNFIQAVTYDTWFVQIWRYQNIFYTSQGKTMIFLFLFWFSFIVLFSIKSFQFPFPFFSRSLPRSLPSLFLSHACMHASTQQIHTHIHVLALCFSLVFFLCFSFISVSYSWKYLRPCLFISQHRKPQYVCLILRTIYRTTFARRSFRGDCKTYEERS